MIKKFKLRAEVDQDLESLFDLIPDENIGSVQKEDLIPGLPDKVVTVELSEITLDQLKGYIQRIEDGHVMLETVALEKDYTGKRTYTE